MYVKHLKAAICILAAILSGISGFLNTLTAIEQSKY